MQTPEKKWHMSADAILKDTSAYAPHVRDAVRALYHVCVESGITIYEAADGIGYHRANLHKICTGKYDGDLDAVADAIEDYLFKLKDTQPAKPVLFVETDTSRQIFEVAQAAWDHHTIGAVWGDPQIGKTHALQEFARRQSPGRVKFVRIPSGCCKSDLIIAFGEAFHVPAGKARITLTRQRIKNAINYDDLLIIDEIHELFLTATRAVQLYAMEVIREIYDLSGCGLVICGTNVGRDAIEEGPLKSILRQFDRRTIFPLQLPKYATTADLNAIAAHYGLPRLQGLARDIANSVVRYKGLKAYVIYLNSARALAANLAEPIAWKHFERAHDIIAKYSQKEG